MTEYTFELIFKLNKGESPDQHLDVLYEAGCDDATVGTGVHGFLGLSFIRESTCVQTAVETAIKNVKQAIPHAQLERAAPDLLNLSELAFLFGFTKQNMRKYARGEVTSVTKDFPTPVITGKTSYWHAARIAHWLNEQGVVKISDDKLNTLLALWSLNQAIERLQRPDLQMTDNFTALLQSAA
ncbi:MAG: DNA-binding protein [Algicola sp.]|nr:DNA-binding protein [Algicola sp.]